MPNLFFVLMFMVCIQMVDAESFQSFSQDNFYKVLAADDTSKINEQLGLIKKSNSHVNSAYEGTLLMKKSHFLKSNNNKISMFNKGKALLENAIKAESKNAEFRFLRLTIQENCPPAVKYNANKMEDAKMVKQDFLKFSDKLKNAVIEYSGKSKVLKPADFIN